MKIGEQLKRLRKKSGLTQIELSQKLNIVQSLISAVENDKGAVGSPPEIVRTATESLLHIYLYW